MRSLPWAALDSRLSPAPEKARIGWLTGHDYAHRGLHGGDAPENSLSAFSAAIARGLGIECDVQQAGDGQAGGFHDWGLDRLARGSGGGGGGSAARPGRDAPGPGSGPQPRPPAL